MLLSHSIVRVRKTPALFRFITVKSQFATRSKCDISGSSLLEWRAFAAE